MKSTVDISGLTDDSIIQSILKNIRSYFEAFTQGDADSDIDGLIQHAGKLLQTLNPALLPSVEVNIEKLIKFGFLTMDNYEAVLSCSSLDKSCVDRLNQTAFKGEDKQQRWNYASYALECDIARMLDEGASLFDIYDYASQARGAIAEMEGVERVRPYGFGVWLWESPEEVINAPYHASDIYKYDGTGLVDQALFVELSMYLAKQMKVVRAVDSKHVEFVDASQSQITMNVFEPGEESSRKQFKVISVSESDDVPEKSGIIRVMHHFNGNSLSRRVEFSKVESMFDEMMKAIPEQKSDKTSEGLKAFLHNLGKLTYSLVQYYPFERGSAAVTQWVIRAMCKHFFSPMPVSVGDLRFNKIPYDIYAQLTLAGVDSYAENFTNALLPVLSEILKTQQTELVDQGESTFLSVSSRQKLHEKIAEVKGDFARDRALSFRFKGRSLPLIGSESDVSLNPVIECDAAPGPIIKIEGQPPILFLNDVPVEQRYDRLSQEALVFDSIRSFAYTLKCLPADKRYDYIQNERHISYLVSSIKKLAELNAILQLLPSDKRSDFIRMAPVKELINRLVVTKETSEKLALTTLVRLLPIVERDDFVNDEHVKKMIINMGMKPLFDKVLESLPVDKRVMFIENNKNELFEKWIKDVKSQGGIPGIDITLKLISKPERMRLASEFAYSYIREQTRYRGFDLKVKQTIFDQAHNTSFDMQTALKNAYDTLAGAAILLHAIEGNDQDELSKLVKEVDGDITKLTTLILEKDDTEIKQLLALMFEDKHSVFYHFVKEIDSPSDPSFQYHDAKIALRTLRETYDKHHAPASPDKKTKLSSAPFGLFSHAASAAGARRHPTTPQSNKP